MTRSHRKLLRTLVGLAAGAAVTWLLSGPVASWWLGRGSSGELAEGVAGRGMDPRVAEAVRALPYAHWSPAGAEPEASGVTVHDPARVAAGWNLVHLRGNEALLVDMDGEVVHRFRGGDRRLGWGALKPAANGDLLTLGRDTVRRLDWDTKVRWAVEGEGFHHDLSEGPDGFIHALGSMETTLPHDGARVPVLDSVLVTLSADGELIRRTAFSELFGSLVPPSRLAEAGRHAAREKSEGRAPKLQRDDVFDVFHANTVDVLHRDVPGLGRRGDLLTCVRELDLVAILDGETREVLWTWGPGVLDKPHHPSVLEDGTLLVFDNGPRAGRSRILEIEPTTGEIVWSYQAERPDEFFSKKMGSCQRLPNGNTLVVESTSGRVFEITRDGETVWEFYNPERDRSGRRRRIVYRMLRIAANRPLRPLGASR